MTVNRAATRAGKQYETDLINHLRDRGFDVEGLRLKGREDEGDLLVRHKRLRLVVEAKRCKTTDLSGWVREAKVEADNYVLHRGGVLGWVAPVVVHHARGKNISQSYVTMTLEEFLGLIQ